MASGQQIIPECPAVARNLPAHRRSRSIQVSGHLTNRDRVLEHILSLKDFPQPADRFASWVGLSPDDELLLMRDRSGQEIYALDLNFP